MNYLNNHKQALAITGTSNAVSVAEHVMTMFLHLAKNINASDSLVRTGQFKNRDRYLIFLNFIKKKF
jgi:lactate dehydrogenase-like 2-hydroxyacid dehydrogenase